MWVKYTCLVQNQLIHLTWPCLYEIYWPSGRTQGYLLQSVGWKLLIDLRGPQGPQLRQSPDNITSSYKAISFLWCFSWYSGWRFHYCFNCLTVNIRSLPLTTNFSCNESRSDWCFVWKLPPPRFIRSIYRNVQISNKFEVNGKQIG